MTYAAVPIKKNNTGSTLDDMKQVYLIAGDIQPCMIDGQQQIITKINTRFPEDVCWNQTALTIIA